MQPAFLYLCFFNNKEPAKSPAQAFSSSRKAASLKNIQPD